MDRAEWDDFRFDIVINASQGLLATLLIADLLGSNSLAVKVITYLKDWARAHDHLGASTGRLSSHGLTVFAISYLVSVGVLGLGSSILTGTPHLKSILSRSCMA